MNEMITYGLSPHWKTELKLFEKDNDVRCYIREFKDNEWNETETYKVENITEQKNTLEGLHKYHVSFYNEEDDYCVYYTNEIPNTILNFLSIIKK